jgi:hypothetical protein
MPSCSYASWPQGLIVVSAEHPIRAAARLTRRLPGYRFLRRRAVPRIRQSAAARALAHRMFPPAESTASGPPADIATGRLLAGLGIERLPVILLNLVGLADDLGERVAIGELVDDVIDDVAQLQLLGAGFRPVFLLDVPAFNRARSYGYVVELVTPRTAWSAELPDWSEYIAARVASMTKLYGVSAMISVGPRGLGDVARGVLRSFG